MKNILILGGSGFVGSVLCESLVRRHGGGLLVTVPTRRPTSARHLQILPTVEVVQADVHDEVHLPRLVAGRDAVINLVGILHGGEADFQRVHVDLPRRVAQYCVAAGVPRLVHISAIGASASAPSRYLRSKAAGEAAVCEVASQSTVMRPSVMYGAGDRFMNRFAQLQAIAPVFPLACAAARFQPVWVGVVAEAVVNALDAPQTAGQTFECAGPRVFTLADLVRMAGRWSGRERLILPLPKVFGYLEAWVMEWLPGEPLMSRDNLRSMQVPNIASSDQPGLAELGITATDIEAVMPAILQRGGEAERLNRWRAAVHRR